MPFVISTVVSDFESSHTTVRSVALTAEAAELERTRWELRILRARELREQRSTISREWVKANPAPQLVGDLFRRYSRIDQTSRASKSEQKTIDAIGKFQADSRSWNLAHQALIDKFCATLTPEEIDDLDNLDADAGIEVEEVPLV